MQAAIVRNRDLGVAVRVYVAEINSVALAGGDRRIAARADAGAIGNGAHHPGQTIICGNGNAGSAITGCVLAVFIWDISRAVGRNANVSMQAAASSGSYGTVHAVHGSESVNGNAGSKRQTAVIATRAERSNDILRAVINCVWIGVYCRRG